MTSPGESLIRQNLNEICRLKLVVCYTFITHFRMICFLSDVGTVIGPAVSLFEIKIGNKYYVCGYLYLSNILYFVALHWFEHWKFLVNLLRLFFPETRLLGATLEVLVYLGPWPWSAVPLSYSAVKNFHKKKKSCNFGLCCGNVLFLWNFEMYLLGHNVIVFTKIRINHG